MNERYVLTGGPCCGKTTVINELSRRGYDVLPEVAREVLLEIGSPKTPEDGLNLEKIIFQRQVRNEADAKGNCFLDRGIPDVFAYSYHLHGKLPEGVVYDKNNIRGRYSKVFILEPIPFVNDGLRIEKGAEEALALHHKIIQAYVDFGYNPVFVPRFDLPIEEAVRKRAEFILSNIGGENGN